MVKEYLNEMDIEVLLADGFDGALIGYAETSERELVVLYDRNKFIDILIKEHNMDKEEALEYFEINVIGSNLGVGSPIFATIF